MKAAYFMKNGGPEVMQYGDVPEPSAGPGQVLGYPHPRAQPAPVHRGEPHHEL